MVWLITGVWLIPPWYFKGMPQPTEECIHTITKSRGHMPIMWKLNSFLSTTKKYGVAPTARKRLTISQNVFCQKTRTRLCHLPPCYACVYCAILATDALRVWLQGDITWSTPPPWLLLCLRCAIENLPMPQVICGGVVMFLYLTALGDAKIMLPSDFGHPMVWVGRGHRLKLFLEPPPHLLEHQCMVLWVEYWPPIIGAQLFNPQIWSSFLCLLLHNLFICQSMCQGGT